MFRKKHKIEMPEISFEDYWAHKVIDEEIIKVNEEARKRLIEGDFILDSRYAPFNARGLESAFSVFLTCHIDMRASRNLLKKEYAKKEFKEVVANLRSRETEELRRGQELYGKYFGGVFDYRNEKHYNIVFDTAFLPVEEEVDIILKKIRHRQQ